MTNHITKSDYSGKYSVETDDLNKHFGDLHAVKNLNIKVESGCFYGFLGPNGAGKSTTIKMLTGLMSPSSGTMTLLEKSMLSESLAIKSKLGVVSEDLCLFEHLTAREYLTFVARMYRLPKKTMEDRIDELLELMNLQDTEKKLVVEFSHGMKKKTALAAALIHNPELLFLDEPFEGIDAIASRDIRNILTSLISRGSTIFLTSHILEIVERLCTHVGIISDGELVCQKNLEELKGKSSLEDIFIEAVGESEEIAPSLSWI